MRNWGTHIRITKFSDNRTVNILNQRMNYALRMNHHFDLRGRNVKQPVGLNNLKPFVHHARRVNRDLSSHNPFWMSASLLRCDAFEIRYCCIQKRPTGGRKQQTTHATF